MSIILRVFEPLEKHLDAERAQLLLWIPVAFACGIALYFSLNYEPALWVGGSFTFLSLLLVIRAWKRQSLGLASLTIFMVLAALGFWNAQMRAWHKEAPIVSRETRAVTVSGEVETIQPLPKAQRVILRNVTIKGWETDQTPHKIRFHTYHFKEGVNIGDQVEVRAVLRPPPPPVAPGAYDFQREAYFQNIGAVGYTLARPVILERPPQVNLFDGMEQLRQDISGRIHSHLKNRETAHITTALVTGMRTGVPDHIREAYRDSGLAHLLAISGLHMSLVVGLLFIAVRMLFCLWPRVALRWPVKKIAAIAGLLGGAFYLLLAGAPVPTQRAYLMIAVVFIAVLVDRQAISLRLVAFAAMAILILTPEVLLTPSFQLSFAAVIGLIAIYENSRERIYLWRENLGLTGRFLLYMGLIFMTSIVAELATLALGIQHFNQVNLYNLIANGVAMPLVSFVVMPSLIVSVLAMPLGLEQWPLQLTGFAVDLVNQTALWVSQLPYAVILMPTLPQAGFVAMIFGGLWLCLWKTRWRRWGLVPFVLGFLTFPLTRTPDFLVSPTADLVALKTDEGLYLSTLRREKFVGEVWRELLGYHQAKAFPKPGAPSAEGLICDPQGCSYTARGQTLIFAWSNEGVGEDCRRADVIISTAYTRGLCKKGVYDKSYSYRNGALVGWMESGGIRVQTVKAERGPRRWVP